VASNEQDGKGSAKVGPEPAAALRFDRDTFTGIVLTALGGVGASLTIALGFEHFWCVPHLGAGAVGLCAAIRQSPPWIPLASLASGPSLLLTWYWRTAHRKRDLALRQADVDMRARELDRSKEIVDYERATQARAEVWMAIENLPTGGSKADAALSTFQRAATSPTLAKDALDALTRRLRTWDDSTDPRDEEPEDPELRAFRQRSIETVCLLRGRSSDTSINLRGASLYHLNLRGLDLREADLGGAMLSYSDLRGTILKGANLVSVSAHEAVIDAGDDPTPEQVMLLDSGALRASVRVSTARAR
jgi:hypothetical protein